MENHTLEWVTFSIAMFKKNRGYKIWRFTEMGVALNQHPAIGIFHEINQPAIGEPPWIGNPQS